MNLGPCYTSFELDHLREPQYHARCSPIQPCREQYVRGDLQSHYSQHDGVTESITNGSIRFHENRSNLFQRSGQELTPPPQSLCKFLVVYFVEIVL